MINGIENYLRASRLLAACSSRMYRLLLPGIIAGCLSLAGCQSSTVQSQPPAVLPEGSIVMLPFLNRSETPLAGERAEAIAFSVLREQGLSQLRVYDAEPQPNGLPMLDDLKRLSDATDKAIEMGMRYAIAGSVEEWRYKAGLDGEPAVGLSMRLVDLDSGEILWSGSAARSGWSRGTLSGTAHKVLEDLAHRIVGR